MNSLRITSYRLCAPMVVALALVAAPAAQAGDFYQQHNLASDGFIPADHLDANLVNAWGVAFNPFGPVWVADNGTGVSTLYDGAGNAISLVVNIPSPGNSAGGGNPTGIVFNGSTGFAVTKGNNAGPSKFIFATEDGLIAREPRIIATVERLEGRAIALRDATHQGDLIQRRPAPSCPHASDIRYPFMQHPNSLDDCLFPVERSRFNCALSKRSLSLNLSRLRQKKPHKVTGYFFRENEPIVIAREYTGQDAMAHRGCPRLAMSLKTLLWRRRT